MPSMTKTKSILASEHLQDVLNTHCGFLSVQYEFEKTLKLIRPPVHLKVTDGSCSWFFNRVQCETSPQTAERIYSMVFWHSKKSGSGNCFKLIPERNFGSQQITATDSYRGHLCFHFGGVFMLFCFFLNVVSGHRVSSCFSFSPRGSLVIQHIFNDKKNPKNTSHLLYQSCYLFLLTENNVYDICKY